MTLGKSLILHKYSDIAGGVVEKDRTQRERRVTRSRNLLNSVLIKFNGKSCLLYPKLLSTSVNKFFGRQNLD